MRRGRIAWSIVAIVAAIVVIVAVFKIVAGNGEAATASRAASDRRSGAMVAGGMQDSGARSGIKSAASLGRVSLGTGDRTSRRPLPPQNRPLGEILPELETRVREGDAAAACRIGFELDRCNKIATLRTIPDFWREVLAKQPADSARRQDLQWHIGNAEANLAGAEVACANLDPSVDTTLAWDYTLAAALAGNREAIWNASVFPMGLDVKHPENTLEGWTQWRAAAPQIVALGLQGGDPRMFSIASRYYLLPAYGGRIFDQDAVRSLALTIATETAVSAGYLAVVQHNEQYIIDSNKLTPQQVQAARDLVASLPPVRKDGDGFDWSRGMNPNAQGSDCERQ